jgi:hypothetical protein
MSRLVECLVDPEQPVRVIVLRKSEPTYDELNTLIPGGWVEVARTEIASVQPVSSETIQREAGLSRVSTHELFCVPLDIQGGDKVRVEYLRERRTVDYSVNGVPRNFATHLEVSLVWPTT